LTTQVTPLLLAQIDGYERYRNSIKKITLELKTLEKQQQYFQQNQAKYTEIELELQRLKRDHDTKNTLYLDLLTRHEMVSISNALGEYESATNVKIITRPFIPEQTINLPIISYILLGLLLGIIQGVTISIALSTTQDTLWDETKIAHVMGLKIIARVPLISSASG